MSRPAATRATLIPGLRYSDADAAIDWLVSAFAFAPRAVYRDEEGRVVHAELTFGNGMVMIGPDRPSEFGTFVQRPAGGRPSLGLYAVVEDADAHHARAAAMGANVLIPLKDEDYGGRSYTCHDPEAMCGPLVPTIRGRRA